MNTTLLRASWHSWWDQRGLRVGPPWLAFLWTFLFALMLAVGFTVLGFALNGSGNGAWRNLGGWWHWYQRNLVIALVTSYAIHFLFDATRWLIGTARIDAFSERQRALYFGGVPLTGVALSWPVSLWLLGANPGAWFATNSANSLAASVLLSLVLSFILYKFFAIKARQIEAERAATEARLKFLQAQIEPHFLFNTLANVVGLMDADTPRAKAMLESFVDYLRSSLGSMRREQNTLGDELLLVEAYMRIIQIRMDDRLAYRIDVPESLRALPLPALTLQPLVENAIQHGLEPKVEGGNIQISARLDAGQLVLRVVDDGLGLDAKPRSQIKGSGTALRNIRERLAESHGSAARLQIDPAQPQGVCATLSLPIMMATQP